MGNEETPSVDEPVVDEISPSDPEAGTDAEHPSSEDKAAVDAAAAAKKETADAKAVTVTFSPAVWCWRRWRITVRQYNAVTVFPIMALATKK